MVDAPVHIRRIVSDRGFTRLRPAGGGVEFQVFAAESSDGAVVVLRTPVQGRFQFDPNDGHVDTRSLLRWEYAVTRHLGQLGFPVATPYELCLGEADVLVSEFLPDDGRGADQVALGALLRQLHQAPLPPMAPVAAHGLPPAQLLAQRMAERLAALVRYGVNVPPGPPVEQVIEVLAARPAGRLLHLDVRASNLRSADGHILGVLDWSNALVGDPAMELGRLAEYALVDGNGVDYEQVLAGYGEGLDLDSPAFWIYRLDTAVMLALLFSSNAADTGLGPAAIDRLQVVHERVRRALAD
ncbi:phosphotransferase family protein [Kribbella albertanoniae]|nr:phosphotransferase [Kribbella albertanoniae]